MTVTFDKTCVSWILSCLLLFGISLLFYTLLLGWHDSPHQFLTLYCLPRTVKFFTTGQFPYSIQIPRSLFKKAGYDHSVALFGTPSYGGAIALNVYYIQSDLCDTNVNTTIGVPTILNWKPNPYILMVDRSLCPRDGYCCNFVTKVRDNVENSTYSRVRLHRNVCSRRVCSCP
jgi:hypothetical protein